MALHCRNERETKTSLLSSDEQLTVSLGQLLSEVRGCGLCIGHLPHEPRPVLSIDTRARLLIIGQAPGTKVHASGVPWNDSSGDRLRLWLDMDRSTFYDKKRVAIIPMGLCYPGRNKNGGDLPPRPECAPTWHARLLSYLPEVSLTLLVGGYAQRYYLGDACGKTVTATVSAWRDYLPYFIPIPHPSWRTRGWVARNRWFEIILLPELRQRVASLVSTT
ncbi:MAG: uracil-DNA glycosylase family protein [Alphaproteobacteria bacterium]|jgi:uracil-DNA glycosylase